jgi:hypothetical protein
MNTCPASAGFSFWSGRRGKAPRHPLRACVVLLRRGEVFYVLEVIRGRFAFDALKRKVMEVKRRYGSGTLLIEDSPISKGLIQSLRLVANEHWTQRGHVLGGP